MNYSTDFIKEDYINELLNADVSEVNFNEILEKANDFKGLNHKEVAALLNCEDESVIEEIFKIAKKTKKDIYGDRIVMFAPIYISDYCVNTCDYCGFKSCNETKRRKLTAEELKDEVKVLVENGHKRLALEAGEDPENCPIEYVIESIKTIYSMKFKNGNIRRLNVNIAATSVEEFKMLKDAEIGTYILFQETYHRESYDKFHIAGPKKNYDYHTTAFHRAMEAGIDDVGGGVLFGLYEPNFEVLALMLHNEELENKFGVGFHTVSMPRIRKAKGMVESKYKYSVEDKLFLKLAAIIRVAIPYTGIIISTRESEEMRLKLFELGITQVSGGSKVGVGAYKKSEEKNKQFEVADERTQLEVAYWLMEQGLLPSFCTACYRSGRTGDRFMSLAKSGNIKNVCLPNGILTLMEYTLDYGDEKFADLAYKLIDKNIENIGNNKVKKLVLSYIEEMKAGKRDLFV
ncbi:MAG: [FeFe] hydrogenase H-cluster radical SAM maturase HydG [Lachnospirales bacterium]